MPSVFISYAREDQAFVHGLHAALVGRGFDVWVDWHGIPPSADYLREIERAIDRADAVLVVISPDLADSRVCALELQHAIDAQKRLIPILRRGTRSATVHDAIRRLNWIPFQAETDQAAPLEAVISAIESDLDWVTAHTRLLLRAGEWEARGHDQNLLLRGRPLREAEEWIAGADIDKDPRPTATQRRFLLASRRAATGRARRLIAASAVAVLVSLALALVAFLQREDAIDQRAIAVAQRQEAEAQRKEADRQRGEAETQRAEAERQRNEAESQRAEAETQAALARSRALAANATALLPSDPELAIRLSVEALGLAQTHEAETALRRALGTSHLRLVAAAHDGRVLDLHINAAGTRLFSTGIDGTVRALDAATGDPIWQTAPAPAPAIALALSPDERLLAGGGADGVVRLWNAADGAPGAELPGHTGIVWAVAFSPDGTRLASCGDDGAVRVWDAASGALRLTLQGDGSALLHLAFSPDGSSLTAGSTKGTTLLWSMPTGGEPRALIPAERDPEFYEGAYAINHVRFSQDGASLLAASYDGSARLWDTRTGEQIVEMLNRPILSQIRPFVSDAVFSPDGTLIATASSDGVVRLWNAATGAREADLRGLLDAATAVTFSADGRRIAAASFDGTARVWDVATGAPTALLAGHAGYVEAVVFDPTGERVATSGRDGTVRVWEADTGAVATHFGGATQQGMTAAVLPDGGILLVDAVGTATAYDADGTRRGEPVAFDPGHFFAWSVGTIAPGGGLVATGDLATHNLDIWDPATGTSVVTLRGHTDAIRGVAWSPNGRLIATAGADGTARLWDADTGELRHTLAHPSAVETVAFAPDGATLAAGGDDGIVRVWDVTTGQLRTEVPLPAPAITYSLSFDPAGSRLAIGGGDNAVHIWDLAAGRYVAELRGHPIQVTALAWTPDGARIVSGDWGGELRIWDAATGEQLAVLHGHRDTIRAIVVTNGAAGDSILSVALSGPARLTPCDVCGPIDHLLAVAAARRTRDLTADERRRFLDAPATPVAAPDDGAIAPASPVAAHVSTDEPERGPGGARRSPRAA